MIVEKLTIDENMIGIRVHLHNFLWCNWSSIGHRNVKTDVSFTAQRLHSIKSVLKDTFLRNLNKKRMVRSSAESYLGKMKLGTELCLGSNDNVKGGALIASSNLKPEAKFSGAERLAMVTEGAEKLITRSKFYSKIIISVDGSIGSSLVSPDSCTSCRVSFSPRVFELAK